MVPRSRGPSELLRIGFLPRAVDALLVKASRVACFWVGRGAEAEARGVTSGALSSEKSRACVVLGAERACSAPRCLVLPYDAFGVALDVEATGGVANWRSMSATTRRTREVRCSHSARRSSSPSRPSLPLSCESAPSVSDKLGHKLQRKQLEWGQATRRVCQPLTLKQRSYFGWLRGSNIDSQTRDSKTVRRQRVQYRTALGTTDGCRQTSPKGIMATVTETLSIVDSLYQSRETLLHHTFTPFASLAHAPHSLVQLTSPRGPGCTVSIGPHAFLGTHIYLCDWNPSGAGTGPTPPPPPAAAPSPAPLSTSAITPSLVARLNEASQEDRKLAETLRKAANGQASADELAGLATFIEHLRRQEEAEAANPPLPAGGSGAPPSVVLDFAETRYPSAAAAAATSSSRKAPAVDRRVVLPAHFVLTPLPPRNQNPMQPALFHDVLLSLFIFPSELTPPQSARGKQRLQAAPEADLNAPVPVDIVVEGCDQRMLDGLWRAARNGRPRDDQLERWARQMVSRSPWLAQVFVTGGALWAKSWSLPSCSDAITPLHCRSTRSRIGRTSCTSHHQSLQTPPPQPQIQLSRRMRTIRQRPQACLAPRVRPACSALEAAVGHRSQARSAAPRLERVPQLPERRLRVQSGRGRWRRPRRVQHLRRAGRLQRSEVRSIFHLHPPQGPAYCALYSQGSR